METDFTLVERARPRIRVALAVLFSVAILSSGGCAIFGSRSQWTPPPSQPSRALFTQADPRLDAADAQFQAGVQRELWCDPACIDHYFAAANEAWPCHVASGGAADRATELYQSSVRSFLEAAIKFNRFDRNTGVLLANGQVVPVSYQGFVWQPCDFCEFLPVGSYHTDRLSTRYAWSGVGVPYVVLSTNPPRHPFTRVSQPFSATAVVAPSPAVGGGFSLQFYDPLRVCVSYTGLPIARDLTASVAYAASQETDAWLADFLEANSNDPLLGLHMREPFQQGKIPIVFVHGLASDPLTWAQMENDLRAQPALFARYQFWFYRYDTGDPFLASAARLRRDLTALRQTYDPMRMDPNLSQMVLVGHSMGGLVSKMQVTYSGDMIWNAAATQPFNTIVTDPDTRERLANNFFFGPSPDVRRVIYIATPHRGSSDATRCVGRISSALVKERPDWTARHQQLVRDNPCAFRDELRRGIPTSIDLLEPSSQILQATNAVPYGPGVALHSVIGDARWSPIQGRSDGVVSVESARIGGVQSELFVDATHTHVQRDSQTVREVMCILGHHAVLVAY